MKKQIMTALLMCATAVAMAQSDWGAWTEVSAEYEITKKWDVAVEGELRTRDFLKSIDRYSIGATTSFSPTKIFNVGVGYDFIDSYRDSYETSGGNIVDDYWRIKNRLYLQTKFKFKPSIFNVGVRLRYQYTNESRVSIPKYSPSGKRKENKVKEAEDENVFRSKLSVSVKATKLLRPFVSYELSNDLDDSFGLKRQRIEAGTAFRINKKNSINLSYKRNIYKGDDEGKTKNVIGISYEITL